MTGFSMIEQLQTIRLLHETYNEYNVPLHLAFTDYDGAFDSVGLWVVNNARIDSKYRDLPKYIYQHGKLHTDDFFANVISMQRDVGKSGRYNLFVS